MEEVTIISSFYLLLCICIVLPPQEFVTAGFTIASIFAKFLGTEELNFVQYHIKRVIVHLLVYSLLPLGYIILTFGFVQDVNALYFDSSVLWKVYFTSSVALPLLALYLINNWIRNDYEKHPITLNLSKFCNNNTDWKSVSSNINIEFRRVDKIIIVSNTLQKIVTTENWIIKVCPLTMYVMHQSDASLIVKNADTASLSQLDSVGAQFLNIEVKCERSNIEPFMIRINSTSFRDLENRIARSITVLPNVKFHKTVIEQFVEVFKETIRDNAPYNVDQELDHCIGCLQARPNIKIRKLCPDNENDTAENKCSECFCRPMWCDDCIGKWFASRQDMQFKDRWLESKCTCPMCRTVFCVLDVSYLKTEVVGGDNNDLLQSENIEED